MVSIISNGYNLIENTSGRRAIHGTADTSTNIASRSTRSSGPTANNGGPTFTHELLPSSPALDQGKDFALTGFDQRGNGPNFIRPFDNPTIMPAPMGDNSDIGAFELNNTPPTIMAVATTRQQGSPVSNSTIANVTDAEDGNGGPTVTVNGGAAATVNGVTVSNIVNTAGVVTADVIASCTATNASFTLTATDGGGLTATATLDVTVTANTPPALSYNNPPAIVFGSGTTVNPAAVPTDNGTIVSYSLNVGTYTGGSSVNQMTGAVTFTGAQPVGNHMITVTATDNCGATTPATFTLSVIKADTTTTITSDLPDPSVFGENYTVVVAVAPVPPGAGTPTGTITVNDGGGNMCTIVLPGGTSCSLPSTSVGPKVLTATYPGDMNFNPSGDTESHQVNQSPTTTTITSDLPDPSVVGQSVTVNYTVVAAAPGAGTPTGNVVVTISGGAETCTGTVAAGTCTLTLTTAGARTFTATYSGDTNFLASSDTEDHQVNQAATTTTIISDNPEPICFGTIGDGCLLGCSNPPGAGRPTGNVVVTIHRGGETCTGTVAAGQCSVVLTAPGYAR